MKTLDNSGRCLTARAGHEPSPTVSAVPVTIPIADRVAALRASQRAAGEALTASIPEGHQCGVIHATADQWEAMETAIDMEKQARAALMPTEQDAIDLMHDAYQRLKELDWNDPIYCPKDGSSFDVIEAGSSGIHRGHYSGEWPTGHWWVEGDGDLYPSRPTLYRRTEAEKAKWAKLREAFASDRDGSPKGGDACGSVRSTKARAEGIAETQSESPK